MAHNHRPLKIREQSLWFWLGTFDGAPRKGTWNIGIRLHCGPNYVSSLAAYPAWLQSFIHNRLATITASVVPPAINTSLSPPRVAASTALASPVLAPAAGVAPRFASTLTCYHTTECRDECFPHLGSLFAIILLPFHFSGSANSSST